MNDYKDKLSENELKLILKYHIPNSILIEPLKSEKYNKYTHGFRFEHLPFDRIYNAYLNEESLENILNEMIDKLIKSMSEEIKSFDCKEIDENHEIDLRTLCQLSNELVKKDIMDINLFIKLMDIVVPKDGKKVIDLIEDIYNDKKKEIVKKEEKIESLNQKINKLNKQKINKDKVNEVKNSISKKYDKKISEKEKKLSKKEKKIKKIKTESKRKDNKINNLKIKQKKLKQKKEQLNEENRKLSKQVVKYKNKNKELTKKFSAIEKKCFKDVIKEGEINKKLIKVAKLPSSEDKLVKKFKNHLTKLEIDNEKDWENIWENWCVEEKQTMHKLFSSLIINNNLEEDILSNLRDIEFLLKIRLLLIKIIKSITHKYIGEEIYDKYFRSSESND